MHIRDWVCIFIPGNHMKKIAIAITGASGSIYAKVLMQKMNLLKAQVA